MVTVELYHYEYQKSYPGKVVYAVSDLWSFMLQALQHMTQTGKKFCKLLSAETQYDSRFVPQYDTFPNDWQVWTW